jgi:hypothetical protein
MVTKTENCTNLVLAVLRMQHKELTAVRISKIIKFQVNTVIKGVCMLRKKGHNIETITKNVVCENHIARIAYYRIIP